jgi:hypothetical protein
MVAGLMRFPEAKILFVGAVALMPHSAAWPSFVRGTHLAIRHEGMPNKDCFGAERDTID